MAFSEVSTVPSPSPDGAMTTMTGTVRVMAGPSSKMENFLYSGLASWDSGTPRKVGLESPQTNPAVAFLLPHPVEKQGLVPAPFHTVLVLDLCWA